MKGTPMKLVGVISTAVLSLTLGAAAPVYAQQDQHDQQEEQKVQPAQDEKKAQPDKPVKPEEKGMQPPEKNAKPEEKSARQPEKSAKPEERNAQQQDNNSKPEEKNAKQQQMEAKPGEPAQRASGNSNGRIPDDRYKANFGSEHTFRVTQGDYNNRRFQYGGYSFGFVGEWPSNWLYTQNLYVIDIDGVYYLCNPAYPGVNIALSVNL
jgi:outer membrane biosynthesis protein TonB